jgi:uncharacterized protein YcnI
LLRRVAATLVLTAGLAATGLLTAGPASAHITVSAPGVVAGATDAVITLQVPDESASASTIGLKVQLPTDHPIAGVLVAPLPGWTAKIVRTKLTNPIQTDDGELTEVVSEIDWTADPAAGIKPGYFGQFSIIGGKLPDGVNTLTFKAIQRYSDNSVVSWIEQAAPGSSAQPEHPAPVLTLAGAGSSPAGTSDPRSTAGNSTATVAVVLGAIGILLAAVALAAALSSRRAAGSSGSPSR